PAPEGRLDLSGHPELPSGPETCNGRTISRPPRRPRPLLQRPPATARKGPRMLQRPPYHVAIALLLALLTTAPAHADPVSWSYTWSGSPTSIGADIGPSGKPGTGTIFLLDPQPGQGTDSMHTGATQLGLNTSADPATPDHFTNKSYSLALT